MLAAIKPTPIQTWASGTHLDLIRALYVLYGLKYIDLVSLAPFSGLGRRLFRQNYRLYSDFLHRVGKNSRVRPAHADHRRLAGRPPTECKQRRSQSRGQGRRHGCVCEQSAGRPLKTRRQRRSTPRILGNRNGVRVRKTMRPGPPACNNSIARQSQILTSRPCFSKWLASKVWIRDVF